MTLKDLFTSKAHYIVEIPLNHGFHLFIEGLDENGCTNTVEEFDINNVKNFCIELIDNNGEVVEEIDRLWVTLDTTVEKLKEAIK